PADILPPAPLDRIAIRHTVGLGDPIREADVPHDDRTNDGLPVSLEAWLGEAGFRYFKIKVTGKLDLDIPRLECIATLLEEAGLDEFGVTLDGNEQFHSGSELQEWLEAAGTRPRLRGLLARTLFIEQP